MASFSKEGYGAAGMNPDQFVAGLDLLYSNDLGELRGERGPNRPEDHGSDNRGGGPIEINPDHRCPPGLGGVGLTNVYYDRSKDLVAA